MAFRGVLRELLPPGLRHSLARLLGHDGFYGDFQSFEHALRRCSGYNTPEIAQAFLRRTEMAGPEVDALLLQALAAFAPIAASQRHLNVLDVGGANGAYYYKLKSHLPIHLTWVVLETEEMARAHRGTSPIRFESDPAAIEDKFDVVFLSGVLQCLPDPYKALFEFGRRGNFVIVNRLPLGTRDRIVIQQMRSSYRAAYPSWILERERFIAAVSSLGKLRMYWGSHEAAVIDGRPLPYCGMLIDRTIPAVHYSE